MIDTQEKFSLFIPIEIEKSSKTGEDRYADMKFKGIASNPNLGRDKQDQWLDPSGFSLDQFLREGTINYHHLWKDKPLTIIGEPTKAHITKGNELYVEGKLYKDSPIAREVYDLAEILEKNSDTRRLGFSIEGIPLLKDPKDKNRILKARITQLAITPAPICPGTKMELMKGGLDDLQFANQESSEYIIDIVDNGVRYTVDKGLEIRKADQVQEASTAAEMDRVTTLESVDRGDRLIKDKKKKKKSPDGYMSKGEAYIYLMDEHNLDGESAKRVIALAEAIEKGGEGSRGGKVIGHTRSGKPIYDKFNHSSHSHFTDDDHDDAAKLHLKKMSEVHSELSGPGMSVFGSKEKKDKINNKVKHHKDQFINHTVRSEVNKG